MTRRVGNEDTHLGRVLSPVELKRGFDPGRDGFRTVATARRVQRFELFFHCRDRGRERKGLCHIGAGAGWFSIPAALPGRKPSTRLTCPAEGNLCFDLVLVSESKL